VTTKKEPVKPFKTGKEEEVLKEATVASQGIHLVKVGKLEKLFTIQGVKEREREREREYKDRAHWNPSYTWTKKGRELGVFNRWDY
jgi:hypothetical protein